MRRTDRRSDCPINFALQIIGDEWSLLVLRDLAFKGKSRYSEFLDSGEGVSTNILAERLRRLAKAGIVVKRGQGRATRYLLTRKGADLIPLMVEMIRWSARYDDHTAAPEAFTRAASDNRAALIQQIEDGLKASGSLIE